MSHPGAEPPSQTGGRLNLKDLGLDALREHFHAAGIARYHADQVAAWLYQRGVEDPLEMTDLDLELRRKLSLEWETRALELEALQASTDGTRKLVLRTRDSELVEAVVIPEERRHTLCVSTQVGCPLACYSFQDIRIFNTLIIAVI